MLFPPNGFRVFRPLTAVGPRKQVVQTRRPDCQTGRMKTGRIRQSVLRQRQRSVWPFRPLAQEWGRYVTTSDWPDHGNLTQDRQIHYALTPRAKDGDTPVVASRATVCLQSPEVIAGAFGRVFCDPRVPIVQDTG